MDPVTPILAVVATVCAIVSAVQAAQTLRDRYKKRKAQGEPGSGRDNDVLDTTKGMFNLSVRVNYLVAKFGREFGTKSGGKILNDIFALRPDIQTLVADLEKLEHDLKTKGKGPTNMDQRWKLLAGEADALSEGIQNACNNALAQFVKTQSIDQAETVEGLSAITPRRPLEFCYGALLCQTGKSKARDLSVTAKDEKTLGFVCRYCFLEVADYDALRFSTHGQAIVYSDFMAASHGVACASFADRRAHYKCLACFDNHLDVDLPSASALEKHMEQHPGYSFVKNEPDVVQATNDKIRYWVLQPRIEPQPVADSSDGDNPSDDVSPLGTPEMTPRVVGDGRIGDGSGTRRRPVAERPPAPAAAGAPHVRIDTVVSPSSSLFPNNANTIKHPPKTAPPLPPTRYAQVEHELPASKFREDPAELPAYASPPEAVELSANDPGMDYRQFSELANVQPLSLASDKRTAPEQPHQHNHPHSRAQAYAMPTTAYQHGRDLDNSKWRGLDPRDGQTTPGSVNAPPMMEQGAGARSRPPSRASTQSFQSERGEARASHQHMAARPQPFPSQPGQWDRQPHVERPYQAPQSHPQPAPSSTKTKKTGFMGIGGRK